MPVGWLTPMIPMKSGIFRCSISGQVRGRCLVEHQNGYRPSPLDQYYSAVSRAVVEIYKQGEFREHPKYQTFVSQFEGSDELKSLRRLLNGGDD